MLRKTFIGALLSFGTFMGASFAFAQTGDAKRGEKLFRRCLSCHQVGDDAKQRSGPVLNGIVGGPIAGKEGFKYSKALLALADAGETWTVEALDAFLLKPRNFAKGTKMSFSGLAKPEDRADVIAYLATFSDGVEDAAGFKVDDEVLAIIGDVEFGEYLSSECTTCHQIGGADDGIPSIVGWETENFVTAMHSYREKHREHPVMQMIAGRLDDEEIAALAAYFGQLAN